MLLHPSPCLSSVAPTFQRALDPTNVTFPNKITLTCIATARPQPNITWYKDGVELMMGGRVSVTSSEVGERVLESTLTVLSPFLEGIGTYTCVAENVVDTANSTADVIVFCESLPHSHCTSVLLTHSITWLFLSVSNVYVFMSILSHLSPLCFLYPYIRTSCRSPHLSIPPSLLPPYSILFSPALHT